MSLVNANPLILAPDGGYNISRSVRLRQSASAYFNRTPGSAGNRKTWTWSGWVKRGKLGSVQVLFGSWTSGSNTMGLLLNNDQVFWDCYNTALQGTQTSAAVLRDVSAWYHIVWSMDTTQATATNRSRLYVNGVQMVLSADTPPAQNIDLFLNAANAHTIGNTSVSAGNYFDGYLTEINFIDGQQLTPSSFGETDAITGVWKPKKYAGTYGTNGFFLNFSDNSSNTATTIGKDYSGNGNNWTPNNISVTSGVTYDSMLDVPTMWADGGNGRGNYATLNPVFAGSSSYLSGGNLNASISATNTNVVSTMQLPTSGKWYWEFQITTIGGGGAPMGGIATTSASSPAVFYRTNGNKLVDGTETSYGATYTTTDTIGVAVDVDSGTVTFYKNNSSQGNITYSGGGFYAALRSNAATDVFNINFGQRPFAYTPPTGFKALNTQNLPEPVIKKGNQYMDVSLYTGNAGSITVTNAGFQPDLVWIKGRSIAADHKLVDSGRGASGGIYYDLSSNSSGAESLPGAGVNGLTSTGFTIGTTQNNGYNSPGSTFVAWQWKEGATPGFDIVTYTGTGANRTVAHNLGVAPAMMIVKRRDSGPSSWTVWHSSFSSIEYIYLNLTNAKSSSSGSTVWNSTLPTSSVFSLGTYSDVNASGGTHVAYLFAEVAGFSKFGSYTGNGSSDGPFVFTGFRPRFFLIKATSGSESWFIYDSSRGTYNQVSATLKPNDSSAEETLYPFDLVSNGVKIRTSDARQNANGVTYIYAAFAETAQKFSLAR